MDLMQIWDYVSDKWHLFLYAYLAISFIRSWLSNGSSASGEQAENAKKQDSGASTSQNVKEGKQNIPPVNQCHLSPRKSLGIAYLYFVLGGFVTGTHHIYLGHHAWAVCHSCSGGFLLVGASFDFFLLPFYVWRANGAVLCHPLAPQDSAWTLCRTVMWTLLRWFAKGGFVLFIFIVMVPVIFEIGYDVDLLEGGTVLKPSPYKVLGVSRFAEMQEIKITYKSLSKEFHPDRNPGCEECAERMNEINDAWDRLKRRGAVPGGSAGFREERSEESDAEKAEEESGSPDWAQQWAKGLDKKWQTLMNVGARKADDWIKWAQTSEASKRKKRSKASEEKKKAEKKKSGDQNKQAKTSGQAQQSEQTKEADLLKVLLQAKPEKSAPTSIEEFAYMLKHLNQEEGGKLIDKSFATLMTEFDGNEDGKISLKEILPGDGAERYLAEMFGSWKTSFDNADAGKDGYLSVEEFKHLLKNLSDEQKDELLDPVESILKKFDTDADSKVSLEELLHQAPSWMHPGWKDGFKGADANKDERLVPEELVYLLNHVGKR